MTLALVLAALLAALAVVLAAWPFLRQPTADADDLALLDAAARRRLELAERRDRALGALKELEFDHRTGKVTDQDYRALVGPLRREAAEALRALETATSSRPPPEPQNPDKISSTTHTFSGREGRPTA